MRQFVFWLHLGTGAIAGVVVLIMSVTGVLLMYEKQMVAWADERAYHIEAAGPRMPLQSLIASVCDARQSVPAAVAVRSRPSDPVVVTYGRDSAVFVNPYTGEILGQGSPRVRAFFRGVVAWHRWLGTGEDNRAFGRAITGACNLGFLFLVISGFYLWWPRKWSYAAVRLVTWFRGGLSGKARDFNWHNTAGFWCCVPLFFIVISGAVISYPWVSNLVYQIGGSAPPPRPSPAALPGAPPVNLSLDGIDRAWILAERQAPGWKTITLRLPASDKAPLAFTIDSGTAGQPQHRGILNVSRQSGEIVRWEPFSSYDSGRRLRSWLRFVHTGEYYGLPGQTIAGIASAGGALLVYTGLALALRRLFAWRARRARKEEAEVVQR
jgi:uncharacterized iron-regulated membrane protein